MQSLTNRIKYVLNNEAGGPNIETLIGIGVSMAVGVALYKFGGAVNGWINKGSNNVNSMNVAMPS